MLSRLLTAAFVLACVGLVATGCDVDVEEIKCSSNDECNDNLSCTTDKCGPNEFCTFTINSDKCAIDGKCYSDGDAMTDNGCMVCRTTQTNSDWSEKCAPPYLCSEDTAFECVWPE